jgi:hypothetical protein
MHPSRRRVLGRRATGARPSSRVGAEVTLRGLDVLHIYARLSSSRPRNLEKPHDHQYRTRRSRRRLFLGNAGFDPPQAGRDLDPGGYTGGEVKHGNHARDRQGRHRRQLPVGEVLHQPGTAQVACDTIADVEACGPVRW